MTKVSQHQGAKTVESSLERVLTPKHTIGIEGREPRTGLFIIADPNIPGSLFLLWMHERLHPIGTVSAENLLLHLGQLIKSPKEGEVFYGLVIGRHTNAQEQVLKFESNDGTTREITLKIKDLTQLQRRIKKFVPQTLSA